MFKELHVSLKASYMFALFLPTKLISTYKTLNQQNVVNKS